MRSEEEIRNRIKKLRKIEKREAKDIMKASKNDDPFLPCLMDRANAIQSERQVLEWVLNENNRE